MSLFGRRRSIDSSPSSSSSSDSDSKKHHTEKEKDQKAPHEDHTRSLLGNILHGPASFTGSPQQQPPPYAPPSYRPSPSGDRLALHTGRPFPREGTGFPVSHDVDGSPIFVGSALLESSVHPCKIAPHLVPPCRVPYGGGEHGHNGRYDLLPFQPQTMVWLLASHGIVPQGRQPIEGGYEEHGAKLYHALAQVSGVMVPGKTGIHLGGCNVAFGNNEVVITENYYILCWK